MSSTECVVDPAAHPISRGTQFAGAENILLVEDERLVREVVSEVLRAAGYVVWKADCAAEAVQLFRRYQSDICLLITDVVLPDDRGPDLASKLQALGGWFRTILISGYPERTVLQTPANCSEFSYLPKPFTAGALIQKVSHVLNHK